MRRAVVKKELFLLNYIGGKGGLYLVDKAKMKEEKLKSQVDKVSYILYIYKIERIFSSMPELSTNGRLINQKVDKYAN